MSPQNFTDKTAMIVGASRGLGHGIATTLGQAGAAVTAVARTPTVLADLSPSSATIRTEVADATDPTVAGRLLDRYHPDAVVLVAGASPLIRPLHHHTWETFSANWNSDVRMAFHWLREVLLKPLRPGSRVIVISSGAALQGSPLSGGYAGAKATQRFIATYAQQEADREGLELTFTTILPRITPLTDLGRPAVQAYAARAGMTEEQYMQPMGPPVTPEATGAAVLELLQGDRADLAPAYLLTGAGIQQIP